HLFESLIIADFFKQYFSLGTKAPLYFWRDKNGYIEIDCLVNMGSKLVPIEVKSGQTIMTSFFDSLSKWNATAEADPENGYVIYGGDAQQKRTSGSIVGWEKAGDLITTLEGKES
ncbi:MAG: DUF4143 domain-containing protein, partial [Candidatus Babeliales bacterium]